MSPADAIVGWCVTNAALITIGVFAVALWSQYEEQRAKHRARKAGWVAPKRPGRTAQESEHGWLVREGETAVFAATLKEAHALLDATIAYLAVDDLLREVTESFNREQAA